MAFVFRKLPAPVAAPPVRSIEELLGPAPERVFVPGPPELPDSVLDAIEAREASQLAADRLRDDVLRLKRSLLSIALDDHLRTMDQPEDRAASLDFIQDYLKYPEKVAQATSPRVVVRETAPAEHAAQKAASRFQQMLFARRSKDGLGLNRPSSSSRQSKMGLEISMLRQSKMEQIMMRTSKRIETRLESSSPASPASGSERASLEASPSRATPTASPSLGPSSHTPSGRLTIELPSTDRTAVKSTPKAAGRQARPDDLTGEGGRWPMLQRWWNKHRAWNLRMRGPNLSRYDTTVAGGAVAVADGRLPEFPSVAVRCGGAFACVQVDEVQPGCFKGDAKDNSFAIGVSLCCPREFGGEALRAYEMPLTMLAGYGCNFITERGRVWQQTKWDPGTLRVGDKVGIFVLDAPERDLVIFVNCNQVLRVATDLPTGCDLFLVVDLYGVVTKVSLLNAAPPKVPLRARHPMPVRGV